MPRDPRYHLNFPSNPRANPAFSASIERMRQAADRAIQSHDPYVVIDSLGLCQEDQVQSRIGYGYVRERQSVPNCVTQNQVQGLSCALAQMGYNVNDIGERAVQVNRISRSWVPTLQIVALDPIVRATLDSALGNFKHVALPDIVTQIVSNVYIEHNQGIKRLMLVYSLSVPFSKNPTFIDILCAMNDITGAAENLKHMGSSVNVDLKLVEDPTITETHKSTDSGTTNTWTILLRFSINLDIFLQDSTVCH